METPSSVNFVCQRCQVPIHISDQFDKLNEHVLAELTRNIIFLSPNVFLIPLPPTIPVPIYSNADPQLDSQTLSFDQYVPPFRLTDSGNGTNGFTLISNAAAEGEGSAVDSQRLKVRAELFDKLSNHSDINHPMCTECTDTLIEMVDKKLRQAEEDRVDFERYLDELEASTDSTNVEQLAQELSDLNAEEKKLLQDLASLKMQEDSLNASIKSQVEEDRRLKEEQLKYNREYTKFRRELMITEDETRSVDNQLAYAQAQLDKLKNTNVFDATFHIWHDGHFGTINNFRLGRLPTVPVNWSEINAAWGQTALLLSSLARKMNLTFKRYLLVPYGDHSYIEELETGKQLPLHVKGGKKV